MNVQQDSTLEMAGETDTTGASMMATHEVVPPPMTQAQNMEEQTEDSQGVAGKSEIVTLQQEGPMDETVAGDDTQAQNMEEQTVESQEVAGKSEIVTLQQEGPMDETLDGGDDEAMEKRPKFKDLNQILKATDQDRSFFCII